MSICHWIVEGIGIDTGKLFDYLNREKCLEFLKTKCGYVFDEENPEENFNVKDFDEWAWDTDMNMAEVFCHCDETGLMGAGDDGDGNYYFLYMPSYPWQRRENEPRSIEEVHTIIKKAVKKLCDLSDEAIEVLIDNDIYEYGCG